MIHTAILGGREAARLEDRQSALFFSIAATLTVQFARWMRPYSQVPPCSRKDWYNIATHFVLLWLSARFQARPPDLKTNYPNQVQTDCWQTERCTIRLIQSQTHRMHRHTDSHLRWGRSEQFPAEGPWSRSRHELGRLFRWTAKPQQPAKRLPWRQRSRWGSGDTGKQFRCLWLHTHKKGKCVALNYNISH